MAKNIVDSILALYDNPKTRALLESIEAKVDRGDFNFTEEEEEFSLALWEGILEADPPTEEEWEAILEAVKPYIQ